MGNNKNPFNVHQKKAAAYDKMKANLADRGMVLLTPPDAYTDYSQKVEVKCKKNHLWITSFKNIHIGSGCLECHRNQKGAGIDSYLNFLSKKGLDWKIIKVPKWTKLPATWECPKGHQFDLALKSMKGGATVFACPHCKKERMEAPVLAATQAQNGQLVSLIKESSGSRVTVKCHLGHVFNILRSTLLKGSWCKVCAKSTFTLDDLKTLAVENGGDLLSTSVRFDTDLYDWECCIGHTFRMNPREVRRGRWCPTCSGANGSKAQREIYRVLLPYFSDAVYNDRTAIGPKELDIYIPSISAAIEYDGTRWHDSAFAKAKNAGARDAFKEELCLAKGIRLYRVAEADFKADKAGVLRNLLRWLLD